MANDELIAALMAERSAIQSQMAELHRDLEAIERSITRLQGQHPSAAATPVSGFMLRPADAIRRLFESFPERLWTAPQLRDQVERLRREGKVNTASHSLLSTVHSILQRLVKQGYIEPLKSGKTTGYKRKEPGKE